MILGLESRSHFYYEVKLFYFSIKSWKIKNRCRFLLQYEKFFDRVMMSSQTIFYFGNILMRIQNIVIVGIFCLVPLMVDAKLIARRSNYLDRVDRSPYHRAYAMDAYSHPQPCCPWRDDWMPNTASGSINEAQSLRESLWNDLDSATYQDDWQWKERRIREIETRLGHIVDWPR
jgi:hypothetical protein